MYVVYHIKQKGIDDINKGYVGVSKDYQNRWRHHKHHLKANTHSNPHLQNAWNLYKDNIEFVILHKCKTENEMILLEKTYRPHPNIGWNCKSGGDEYFSHTEATKEKIRNYNLGKRHSEETKRKISLTKKGKPSNRKNSILSESTKELLRIANKGKTYTLSTKKKKSLSLAKYKEPKLWIHLSGLLFFGCHFELRYAYPTHNLSTSALGNVYTNRATQHKGWYTINDN